MECRDEEGGHIKALTSRVGGRTKTNGNKWGQTGLPRLSWTPLSSLRSSFKGLRTCAAKVAVSTVSIVEPLNVIVDICLSDITGGVYPLLDPLFLQAAEE